MRSQKPTHTHTHHTPPPHTTTTATSAPTRRAICACSKHPRSIHKCGRSGRKCGSAHSRPRREAGAVCCCSTPPQQSLDNGPCLHTVSKFDRTTQKRSAIFNGRHGQQEAYQVKHGCQRASVATTAVRISASSRHVNQNRLQKKVRRKKKN
jgi:hypothetical protein